MEVNLKSLIEKLDRTTRQSLEGAASLCMSRTNYNVELEHWLIKLNEDTDTDIARIFRHFEINADSVAAGLTKSLDHLKRGNARTPGFTPSVVDAMRDAWLLSTVEFGLGSVRSGTVKRGTSFTAHPTPTKRRKQKNRKAGLYQVDAAAIQRR